MVARAEHASFEAHRRDAMRRHDENLKMTTSLVEIQRTLP
jgi:hypothetical protein